jgi:chromatin segregation and condensation protein Rec8/ScpA/Scc1 (kleisin family)
VGFFELFEDDSTTQDIVVTFLAVLELARQRRLRVWQEAKLGPIFVDSFVQ